MKKLILSVSGTVLVISSFAQESFEKSFLDDPLNHPMSSFYLVLFLLLIAIALIAVVSVYVLNVVRMLGEQLRREKAQKLGIAFVPSPSWWEKFTQRMNASVPLDQEKNIELDHSYDGIKELDNHLPPWWKWLFYGTIAWSVVYVFVFHFANTLPLSIEEYQNEIALAEEQARQRKASLPAAETIDENKLEFISDAGILEKGRKVFTDNPCGSCHRNDGGGNTIGPNLTDEYWIHGGDAKSIFNTIKNGAVEKGMPAWGNTMTQQDVRDLTFYILSLQGTKPADAKGPQGELFKEVIMKSDTTKNSASL